MHATPLRVAIIGFDGVNAVDLTGPLEAFASVREVETEDAPRRYETIVLGVSQKPFTADSGVVFQPHRTLADAPPLDTVIIPGGSGLRVPATQLAVVGWLRAHAKNIRRICSVCTGIYGLAASGLLDGRRVTTHWRWAKRVAERFPLLKLEANAIFIQDGPYYTSAGVTAGIDLALGLIEQDFGAALALEVAREMVVHFKRDGGQEQYSQPLQFQVAASSDRLAELGGWIPAHLKHDLSVEALAAKACLSPRQFTRRFTRVFGLTPADFVEKLRLDEARRRLGAHGSSVAAVAESVGFASADAFRRAFERRFGVSPRSYRQRFGGGRGDGQKAVSTYRRRGKRKSEKVG
ncbi:MAG: GlxA family transcriptional regulator [Candidatus Koribacter versatilis]|uniref:GlxA family transcriptional regulator n=1 Tax=Candidatus Korobacter versatilis TaxID=658062 RepID=A0A932A8A1_9BACT|nr:GlxA family transcriptional regulator [Candidatus Koribacter versatilis]